MASKDNQVKDITKVCVKGSAKDSKYRPSKIKQWETLYAIILPEPITKVKHTLLMWSPGYPNSTKDGSIESYQSKTRKSLQGTL